MMFKYVNFLKEFEMKCEELYKTKKPNHKDWVFDGGASSYITLLIL